VRTSALAPAAATAFADIGFTVAQELSLLERQHSSYPTVSAPATNAISTVRIAPYSRSIKKSVLADVLAVDDAAFGEQWAMDKQTLREALTATRRVRLFVWKSDGRIEGFVLVGATGHQGFVQRLAVHPNAQRTGIATQLLAASLAWTHHRGCTATVVNTEVSNSAALGAYHRFGFTPLDYGLSVLEMQIP
jgi:GNAT superfamily N-acetyltransferase